MFKGVIHANARAVLKECIGKMPSRVINICSGNFTLETIIRMNGFEGALEGCDVSLYTCALGSYYGGQDLKVGFKGEAHSDLMCFEKYLGDPLGTAAVVAVILSLSDFSGLKNEYQRRMWQATIKEADKIIEGTKRRLQEKKAKINLNKFHAMDGVAVINAVRGQRETLIISSPPTYEGGYERLYKFMDATFKWDQPPYTQIGPEKEFAKMFVNAGTRWMLFTEDRRSEVEAITGLPVAQTARGPNKNVYLYSNLAVEPKLIRRKVECSGEPNWQRLSDADEITENSKLGFARVTFKEANYFRQLYSSVVPAQASAQFCYVLTIDGKLFGQIMLSMATFSPKVNGKGIGGEYLYMMSDLPVASEKHPRLSKLVLACTQAKEFQAELSHRTAQNVNYIFTTAFSHNPVSMKYRGVYQFHSRKKEGAGWSINYVTEAGKQSFKALFKAWFKKHYRI